MYDRQCFPHQRFTLYSILQKIKHITLIQENLVLQLASYVYGIIIILQML